MTDHTIEAHFKVDLGKTTSRDERVVLAMAKALAGKGGEVNAAVIETAERLYQTIKAMRIAEQVEMAGEIERITNEFVNVNGGDGA